MDSVALALTYLRLKAAMTTGNTTLEEYYGALYKDGRPDWGRTKAAFRKLKKICDERDVPLVVLLVPEVHNFSVESPYRKIYGILDSLFKDLNIPFINPVDDLLKAFGPHPTETSVARDDPHPNGPAHKVMADQLSDYLLALDF